MSLGLSCCNLMLPVRQFLNHQQGKNSTGDIDWRGHNVKEGGGLEIVDRIRGHFGRIPAYQI